MQKSTIMPFDEFGALLDRIGNMMREEMDTHTHRFDIDSSIYRKDIYGDFALIVKYLTDRNAKIIDLGCGKGHHSTALSGLGYQNVVGVDMHVTTGEGGIYNAENLGDHWQMPIWDRFKKEFPISHSFYDGKRTEFDDEYFDAIMLYAVIEHVDDRDEFLEECFRILKPGGLVFIYRCPNILSYAENIMKLTGLPHHEKMFFKNELKDLLAKHQFETLFIERYDHFPSFCPIKGMQGSYDKVISALQRVDFIFSPPVMNLFSHHYRGVFRKALE